MSKEDNLRHNIKDLIDDLRANLVEIGQDSLPQAQVVSNTRDRLRYIASLTEQAASQTLNVAESIGDRLKKHQEQAQMLAKRTRSPDVREFLEILASDHAISSHELRKSSRPRPFRIWWARS